MTTVKPNIHDVGFLPGEMSLKYSSPVTIKVLKNRSMDPRMVEKWFRRTRRSLHDLAMANYAFLVDQNPNGSYQIEFVKCRDRARILSWCCEHWGESGPDGQWILIQGEGYNPVMIVHGEENVMLFRLVWE